MQYNKYCGKSYCGKSSFLLVKTTPLNHQTYIAMKVIGLRIEKYIDKQISGHNLDFEYTDAEFEKHIILAVLSNNQKVEIELSESFGPCFSGWTTASWGHIKVNKVLRFSSYNYVPKEPTDLPDSILEFEDSTENELFSFSAEGGDCYYPNGYYTVNMELFKKTPRVKEHRPVWIFKGKSNSGKSYLASKLMDLDVYETDMSPVLPETITESVIVLGNKYNHSVEDITKRVFGESEIQVVEFH